MLYIDVKVQQVLIFDAEKTFPDECCGFLFGKDAGENRFVTAVLIVDNAKDGDKRRRFEISGKDYMSAEKYALENGLDFLGVYHSHPDHPSKASEHDRVAAQPYFSYLILSILKGKYDDQQSWRLNDDSVFEEESVSIGIKQNITV